MPHLLLLGALPACSLLLGLWARAPVWSPFVPTAVLVGLAAYSDATERASYDMKNFGLLVFGGSAMLSVFGALVGLGVRLYRALGD